jgi:hypothetical protein
MDSCSTSPNTRSFVTAPLDSGHSSSAFPLPSKNLYRFSESLIQRPTSTIFFQPYVQRIPRNDTYRCRSCNSDVDRRGQFSFHIFLSIRRGDPCKYSVLMLFRSFQNENLRGPFITKTIPRIISSLKRQGSGNIHTNNSWAHTVRLHCRRLGPCQWDR